MQVWLSGTEGLNWHNSKLDIAQTHKQKHTWQVIFSKNRGIPFCLMKWPATNTHQTQVMTGKKAEHQPMRLVKMSSFQSEQWLSRHQTQFNYKKRMGEEKCLNIKWPGNSRFGKTSCCSRKVAIHSQTLRNNRVWLDQLLWAQAEFDITVREWNPILYVTFPW